MILEYHDENNRRTRIIKRNSSKYTQSESKSINKNVWQYSQNNRRGEEEEEKGQYYMFWLQGKGEELE